MRRGAFVGLALATALVVVSCSSAQRATERRVIPPVVRASCVVLRAFVGERLEEVCATVDELIPLLSEILAQRALAGQGGDMGALGDYAVSVELEPAHDASAAVVKRPAARRCVAWVPVGSSTDAGSSAGGDAGSLDGGGRGR